MPKPAKRPPMKAKKRAKSSAKPAPKHPVRPLTTEARDHLQRVRRLCFAFPDTIEKISHGEPTFFSRNGVFAMFSNNHHNDGHIGIWIPAAPGLQEALINSAPKTYYRPPYVGVSGWVGIELGEIDDDDLAAHIAESWQLIDAKKKKPRSR
jgi:hypothetical protein